jgi:protein SCO1
MRRGTHQPVMRELTFEVRKRDLSPPRSGQRLRQRGDKSLFPTSNVTQLWVLIFQCRGIRTILCAFCIITFSFFLSSSVFAQAWGQGPPPMSSEMTAEGKPRMLESVGIDQKLDQQVPLDLRFKDENGEIVRLGDFFGKRPVIISLVYYNCPMLCNQVLNGLTSALDVLKFDIGKDFEVVTVSFDSRETPELAAQKKETYIKWYKREGAAAGWHFLTGDQPTINRLTDAVGFRFRYDPVTNQFAHASGVMLATPAGKLARYFYGIEYAPKDVRLGLVEASDGKIGSPVDQLLLYCYHYDPSSGKYGAVVLNMIRVAGVATIAGLVLTVLIFKRRAVRNHRVGGVI